MIIKKIPVNSCKFNKLCATVFAIKFLKRLQILQVLHKEPDAACFCFKEILTREEIIME